VCGGVRIIVEFTRIGSFTADVVEESGFAGI
jgi:hypothetical protein